MWGFQRGNISPDCLKLLTVRCLFQTLQHTFTLSVIPIHYHSLLPELLGSHLLFSSKVAPSYSLPPPIKQSQTVMLSLKLFPFTETYLLMFSLLLFSFSLHICPCWMICALSKFCSPCILSLFDDTFPLFISAFPFWALSTITTSNFYISGISNSACPAEYFASLVCATASFFSVLFLLTYN